jgi:hypothetical protein
LTKDVERLLVTISHLLLDQDRVTLGNLIQSCLITLVDSFTDEEWTSSCGNIAAHISRSTFRFPSAMWGFHLYKSFFSLILKGETIQHVGCRLTTEKHNGLHLVRGLCGNCSRMEGLQRAVAMCELSKCLSGQVSDSLVCNVSFINSLKFDDLSVDHSGVL